MIIATNKSFDSSYVDQFYLRELKAKLYNKPFSVVENFYVIGDLADPVNTIPKDLQVFNDTIIYIYIFDLPKTLEWHIDEMRMDYSCTAKYAALIEGSGTLECKTETGIDTFYFCEENKNQWVTFPNTKPHRFIVEQPSKMVMALTFDKEQADNFDVSAFWSTEVDAVNKILWEQQNA